MNNISGGYRADSQTPPFGAGAVLLVPHGMHPVNLCQWFTEREGLYNTIGLPMNSDAAWDVVWRDGQGRGPWQGGTLYGYEHSYAMGIRYDPIKIGDAKYWVPRQAREDELDSADEWKDIADGQWANLPEHQYFAKIGREGWIPKGYGEEWLESQWKLASGSDSDGVDSDSDSDGVDSDSDGDKENEEPRELSPVEPGRMEERGFMTWTAGITVGEN